MGKATRDPLIYVRQINPPRIPKPRYVFDDAAKTRMQDAIDNTIPVREDTMSKPMAVQDFGESVAPTGVTRTLTNPIQPPPLKLQTTPFGTTPPPEAPMQHQPSANKAAVQRFANPDTDPTPDTLMQDLAMEDVGEGTDVTNVTEQEDVTPDLEGVDPDAILKRFKGTPEEIAKQLAKSYGASEKRMRQLEAEKQLLIKGQPAPTPTPQAPTQPAPAQQPQQIVVNPFDYKKAGDTWLDAPEKHLEEFEKHVTNKNAAAVMDIFRPIYIEQLNQKLYRKFGDVINDDNIEVIHAMARTSDGASDYERLTNAAQKYKDSLRPMNTQDSDVEDMKNAARMPNAQGRTTKHTRTYRESDIRAATEKLMRSGEYQKDPRHAARFARLYAEGRIKRGE